MYKPQIKHKAKHSGYHRKPTRKEVNALLDFYGGADKVKPRNKIAKPQKGVQLTFNF